MFDVAGKAREVYFYGMQNGYLKGVEPSQFVVPTHLVRRVTPHILEGWKFICVPHDGWIFMDQWRERRGRTLIIDPDEILIWIKSYNGTYEKAAIPILKMALARFGDKGLFCGGRGPRSFQETLRGNLYTYSNDSTGDFSRFSGTESITTVDGVTPVCMGTHDYSGFLCV